MKIGLVTENLFEIVSELNDGISFTENQDKKAVLIKLDKRKVGFVNKAMSDTGKTIQDILAHSEVTHVKYYYPENTLVQNLHTKDCAFFVKGNEIILCITCEKFESCWTEIETLNKGE